MHTFKSEYKSRFEIIMDRKEKISIIKNYHPTFTTVVLPAIQKYGNLEKGVNWIWHNLDSISDDEIEEIMYAVNYKHPSENNDDTTIILDQIPNHYSKMKDKVDTLDNVIKRQEIERNFNSM